MATMPAVILHKSRRGNITREGTREYEVTYLVRTTDKLDGPLLAQTAPGLPVIGSYYIAGNDYDFGVRCQSIDPQEIENGVWHVTCRWASNAKSGEERDPNPLLRPAEISWSCETFERIAEVDRDGEPIANTAGDPYNPPPTMDDARLVLVVNKNLPSYDPVIALEYTNAVNSDYFMGGEPETWKCMGIPASRAIEGEYVYWPAQFTFHYRRETWALKAPSLGYRHKIGAQFFKCLDLVGGTMQPVSEPVPLDEDGGQLPVGDPVVIQTFNIYRALPFGVLNLF